MILYLDTSSLLKLYVDEQHSPAVRDWAVAAQMLATSRVTYPGARWRRWLAATGWATSATRRCAGHWRRSNASGRPWRPSSSTKDSHAELALSYALRGPDAIQFAAAPTVAEAAGVTLVEFSTFDRQLSQAAQAQGLRVLSMAGQ